MNSDTNSATKNINACNVITCIYKVYIMSDESGLKCPKSLFLLSFLSINSWAISARSRLSILLRWICTIIQWFKPCWVIELLRYVFVCFKAEKLLSAVAVITGIINWACALQTFILEIHMRIVGMFTIVAKHFKFWAT